MKKLRLLFCRFLLLLLLLTFCSGLFANAAAENIQSFGREEPGFSLTMLDVGHGLALLIQSDGKAMLYDGGGRDAASRVISCLDKLGIRELELMIASHYDEDHIAGLVGTLSTRTVKTVLCGDYEEETLIYQSFQKRLEESGAQIIHPVTGDIYALGGAEIEILSPVWYEYENENDRSIAIRITYGDFCCVITGDAEASAEDDMRKLKLDLAADLYVAGHHGSNSSSTTKFVAAVAPQYTFISCGAVTEYAIPGERALNSLREQGTVLFRTDKQGTVTCCTDGAGVWFDQDPCNDWSPGVAYDSETVAQWKSDHESMEKEVRAAANAEAFAQQQNTVDLGLQLESVSEKSDMPELTLENCTYVMNTNSMKFHYVWCESVGDMSERNKALSNDTRDSLEAQGYTPCRRCNP